MTEPNSAERHDGSPCPGCGSDDVRKLSNGLLLCWECGSKWQYDCPNCGFIAESREDLRVEGTGHADVSWWACPECGETSGNQGWSL